MVFQRFKPLLRMKRIIQPLSPLFSAKTNPNLLGDPKIQIQVL
jgi:hypothetical protein